MTQQPAVECQRLRRVYDRKGKPSHVALDSLDLVVERGEVHGLLGPNGAGKTTLCRILATVLLPTAGSATVLGHDVTTETPAVRSLIGIVFGGERGLYGRLTARQNLRYWSALYRQPTSVGKARSTELLARVGLAERADDRVETFSRGMKQRLHLARGLIGEPRVLILDEPTTGMDPGAARDFRELIHELRAEQRTVLITTHDMAEAETVCDRVSLIDDGRLLATKDPRTIGRWLSQYERITASGVKAEAAREIGILPGVRSLTHDGPTVVIETDTKETVRLVLERLVQAGVTDISTTPPSLEDVYLRVIGDRGLEVR